MSDKETEKITCLYCGYKAPMLVRTEYSQVVTHYDEALEHYQDEEGPFWQILECRHCEKVLFRRGYIKSVMDMLSSEDVFDKGLEYDILYPSSLDDLRGLPEQVAKEYKIARKIKLVDPNSYAVSLGRVLDQVCIDKKATGQSLFERLQDLAKNGIVPTQLTDMAHAIRQLRNVGAHANLGDVTSDETPALEAFSRAILEYVYAAPALLNELQLKLNEIKKKQ